MAEWLPFVIDGILAILLLVAIVVFLKVNQRLSLMKAGQDEFTKAAAELAKSVSVAERSVQGIKVNAAGLQETLGLDIKKAQALSDELKLITEAADNLASRIERTLADRPKGPEQDMTRPLSASASSQKQTTRELQREQKELLAALKDAR